MISSPLSQIHLAVTQFFSHFYYEGNATRPTPAQSALKITGELGELAETICKGWSIEEQEKELGDVLVTTIMHAINAGYDLDRIADYIDKKLKDRENCCTVVNGIIVKNKDLNGKPPKNYGIISEVEK